MMASLGYVGEQQRMLASCHGVESSSCRRDAPGQYYAPLLVDPLFDDFP